MAGIGFDLLRLCREDRGLLARTHAYVTAGMVTAGPWLVTMASLWLVRVFAGGLVPGITDATVDEFFAVVSCVFAASLVTTGGLQMAATRWLADLLHGGADGLLVPALARTLVLVAAVQAPTAVAATLWLGFDVTLVLPVTLLYTAVSLSWITFVWLGLIRQHVRIVIVFALGALLFAAALLLCGPGLDLQGLVWLYALVNALVVAALVGLILAGTERTDVAGAAAAPDVTALLRHRTLWTVGTAYAASIWIDKAIFWWAEGVPVGGLPTHPLYDTCFYLAYLTVVPAMAANLVHFETRFYGHYRAFFDGVERGATLHELRASAGRLHEAVTLGAGQLLRVQGPVTVVALWFAPEIVELVGLPPFAAHTLRLALVGALCHVLLLVAVLTLLYFDRQRSALRVTLTFLLLNGALAGVSLAVGPLVYGLGYAAAALVALVVAAFEVDRTTRRLVELTFGGA